MLIPANIDVEVYQADIQDAANDVYSSLQIYLALRRLTAERGFDQAVDLDACSHNISPSGTTYFANAKTKSRSSSPTSRPTSNLGGPGVGPTPAQQRTLDSFRGGMTMNQIAVEQGIKRATVEGYLCRAVIALMDIDAEGLTDEEKKRMVHEVQGYYVLKTFGKLLRGLRRELGEEVLTDNETVREVSDGRKS